MECMSDTKGPNLLSTSDPTTLSSSATWEIIDSPEKLQHTATHCTFGAGLTLRLCAALQRGMCSFKVKFIAQRADCFKTYIPKLKVYIQIFKVYRHMLRSKWFEAYKYVWSNWWILDVRWHIEKDVCSWFNGMRVDLLWGNKNTSRFFFFLDRHIDVA